MSKGPVALYADSKLAKLLRKRLDELKGVKSQRQIADEIGYDQPNIISMFKAGTTMFPLDRIPALSRSIGVDAALLFRLAFEQKMAGEDKLIQDIFGGITTRNQRDWLDMLVEITGEDDPILTPDRAHALREALRTTVKDEA